MGHLFARLAGQALAVTAGSLAFVVLAASPAAASPLFCGSGRGKTAETAINKAFYDAENAAQSEGYYGECTVVGEILVWETDDPYAGHIFRAGVNLTCEP